MFTSRRICAVVLGIFFTLAPLAEASSQSQGRITYLSPVDEPRIDTPSGRAHVHSSFDILFTLHNGDQDVKLTLEPNDDLISDGAKIEYINAAGEVERTEPLVRRDHKVYKGRSWLRDEKGWYMVGWARITLLRDGLEPLFKGAFTLHHNAHHIDLLKAVERDFKNVDWDMVGFVGGRDMVVWRDSDMSSGLTLQARGEPTNSTICPADMLSFNANPEHAVNRMIMEPRSGTRKWGGMDIFGDVPYLGRRGITKRQTLDDDRPWGGIGNSAGVNLKNTIGSIQGCPTTRKVALMGIATDCTYTGAFDSEDEARKNILQVVNAASDLYERTFNITLGLSKLTMSSADCPNTAPSSAKWNMPCENSNGDVLGTIDERLSLFSEWRGGKGADGLALWTLMTTCETGTSVGLAWLGQLCKTGATTNSDDNSFVSSANIVAKTAAEWKVLAHEIGHTMGAVHDCDERKCGGNAEAMSSCCPISKDSCDARGRYLMNPSTNDQIENFSPCSIGNICSAFGRNSVDSSCLVSNRNVQIISEADCGNGIVEEGEDCDCGGSEDCVGNQCCDPATCKFKETAVCDDSNDNCCRGCQFASSDTVCRPGNGDCDPEERCTGKDASCPSDIRRDDGTSCGDGLQCASGQCTSRDQQCRILYDGANSTRACNDNSCRLSCLTESVFRDTCTITPQNFLDGTPCRGDGHCKNGTCEGATALGGVRAWFERHKNIVIGVACGVGALLLLSLICCCCSRIRNKKPRPRSPANPSQRTRWEQLNNGGPVYPMPSAQGPPPMYQPSPNGPPPPQYGQWQPPNYSPNGPPPPVPRNTRFA